MFNTTFKFYGRGNRPRTIRGYSSRELAEEHAYYFLYRYEHSYGDRRIKSVTVTNEHGHELTTWRYPDTYRTKDGILHTH